MKPGKFDEQPIPLMVTTLWFRICNEGLLDRGEHTKISASGTPIGIYFAFEVGDCHMVGSY